MSQDEQHLEFREGNVLVFNGKSLISNAIRLFDGADLNHAAVAIGGGATIEATGDGLRTSPIQEALQTKRFSATLRLPGSRLLSDVFPGGSSCA